MSSKLPRIDAVRFVQVLAASLALWAIASSAHGWASHHQLHTSRNDSTSLTATASAAAGWKVGNRFPGEPFGDSLLMMGNSRMLNTKRRFGKTRKKRRGK